MRTAPCHKATRTGRFRKAGQFLEAAAIVQTISEGEADLDDADVNLCVHSGIASADVICCAVLGKHAQGENHDEAIALLRTADPAAAKHLAVLLGRKTRAGYTALATGPQDVKRAQRAAEQLYETAQQQHAKAG